MERITIAILHAEAGGIHLFDDGLAVAFVEYVLRESNDTPAIIKILQTKPNVHIYAGPLHIAAQQCAAAVIFEKK